MLDNNEIRELSTEVNSDGKKDSEAGATEAN
jgi:hypothetical protein